MEREVLLVVTGSCQSCSISRIPANLLKDTPCFKVEVVESGRTFVEASNRPFEALLHLNQHDFARLNVAWYPRLFVLSNQLEFLHVQSPYESVGEVLQDVR
jgi:hypothetical protein